MSEENKQETPESLKQKFLDYKNTADKDFVLSLIGAVKVCIKYDAQYSYHHKLNQIIQASGGDDRDEPRLYEILYDEISPIMSFDFLTKEVKQTDGKVIDNWIRLAGFFALINIDRDDFLGLSEIGYQRGYDFLRSTERGLKRDYECVRKIQQKLLKMLKNDITKMYAFKNWFDSWFYWLSVGDLQKKYEKKYNDILAECKTIKGDFDKKYKTITETAKKSEELAEEYKTKSMWCFGLAFVWFLFCEFCNFSGFSLQINDNTILMHFFKSQIYQKEVFIFFSKLLFKLPSFVLCLVGVKFLYLFVQYKTEQRELSMLNTFLEEIPKGSEQKKAELVKQLALHFFPDKKANKISQGFLQELMLKMVDKIPTNNSQRP